MVGHQLGARTPITKMRGPQPLYPRNTIPSDARHVVLAVRISGSSSERKVSICVKLSESVSQSLRQAVSRYHGYLNVSPAAPYLESRGLDPILIERFRLGFVSDPIPGHEMYRGRLSIPYLRRDISGEWHVVGINFRVVPGADHRNEKLKYQNLPGALGKPRLYNTVDAIENEDWVCITEGELDAVAASLHGLPAVGVAGATKWADHWTEIFYGFETVYVLSDGDGPGQAFADTVCSKLVNAKNIPMPDGEDMNSTIQKHGIDFVKRRMGLQ